MTSGPSKQRVEQTGTKSTLKAIMPIKKIKKSFLPEKSICRCNFGLKGPQQCPSVVARSHKFFTNILPPVELSFFAIGIVVINFSMQAISLYLPWTLPRLLARFDRDKSSDEKYDYITSIVVLYLILGGILLGGYTVVSRLFGGGTGVVSQIAPIAILTGMFWSIALTYLGLAIYRQSPKKYLAISNGLDFVPLLLSI